MNWFFSFIFNFGILVIAYPGFAQTTSQCEEVFFHIKPFSVAPLNLKNQLLGKIGIAAGYKASYQNILKFAETRGDMLDLVASFRENDLSQMTQRKILRSHPALRNLNAPDHIIDDYISYYNSLLKKNTIDSIDSPLFAEINSSPVINQCNSGTCWINAGTSALESLIDPINHEPISGQFFYLQIILERYLKAAQTGAPFKSGGTSVKFLELIKKEGFVLRKDWQPAIDAYTNHESIPTLLKPLVEKYAEIFDAMKNSQGNERTIRHIEDNFKAEATLLLESKFGQFPSENLLHSIPENLDMISINGDREKEMPQILDKIATFIDQGQEVYIAVNASKNDLSNSKVKYLKLQDGRTGHAMAVVGYIKNSQGNVKLLKIKNSWGTSIGDNGFIYLSDIFLMQSFKNAAGFSLKN